MNNSGLGRLGRDLGLYCTKTKDKAFAEAGKIIAALDNVQVRRAFWKD